MFISSLTPQHLCLSLCDASITACDAASPPLLPPCPQRLTLLHLQLILLSEVIHYLFIWALKVEAADGGAPRGKGAVSE